MPFDFASAKALARRTVHDTLAVPAFYQDDTISVPESIRARRHTQVIQQGALEDGYAQILDGIDRIALIPEDNPEIEFRAGGIVEFVDGERYKLVTLEPADGPLRRLWRVVLL